MLCIAQTIADFSPLGIHSFIFSDLPVKQGMLFSDEDEDVDVQKESGLVASAKITLFEVEINI